MRALLLVVTVAVMLLPGGAVANSAANGWLLIPHSHERDFSVFCSDGKMMVWGIGPQRSQNYRVARDVYIRALPDGRTQISLQRGFKVADMATTYLPAQHVSCEITEQ